MEMRVSESRPRCAVDPQAVLFDFGGTLLHEGTNDLRGGVEALTRHPLFTAGREDRGPGDRGLDTLVGTLSRECDRVHVTNLAGFTMIGWLRDLLPSAKANELAELELALWTAATSMSLLPGVLEVLTELRNRRILLGVVSNSVFSSRVIAAELRRHGLDGFFKFVLSSADVGARKPDPRIFREALDRLKLEASGVWFAGDAWEKDVTGAAAAGMLPFWLSDAAPPAGSTPPHRRIRSWREFLDHLERGDPGID